MSSSSTTCLALLFASAFKRRIKSAIELDTRAVSPTASATCAPELGHDDGHLFQTCSPDQLNQGKLICLSDLSGALMMQRILQFTYTKWFGGRLRLP